MSEPITPPWADLSWLNEARWQVRGDELQVTTAAETDFWRQTHYGFVRDSGHLLHTAPLHDCTVQVRVRGEYQALYDQAGLMLRAGPDAWLKAGVEYVGQYQLSAVVTRPYSDWSVRPAGTPSAVDLKLTRRGDALSVQVRLPDEDWQLLRLSYWPPDLPAVVGVYACSPQRAGFRATFSDFQVGPPDMGPLY